MVRLSFAPQSVATPAVATPAVATPALFALFAFGLWGSLRISSLVGLDAWGRTVFKRAVWATWATWAALMLAHVWFWATEFELEGALIVPTLLLSTRWMPREASVWLAAFGALLSGVMMPQFFATVRRFGSSGQARESSNPGQLSNDSDPA
jgi:hypothetical protein